MRKWIIVICSIVLAASCAAVLILLLGQGASYTAAPAPTASANTTLAAETTLPVHTELPTEPPTQPPTEPPTEPLPAPPDMSQSSARHVFVYDVEKERLLFTKGNQEARIAPASLTKLFTAYVAMQYLDPDDMITVGVEASWIGEGSSIAAVGPGCRLTAGMIMQGMLMQSGNDAAYALAVAAGRVIAGDASLAARPALETFMNEVNRQLQSLGLENTHFTTPDGYDDSQHYTTASELMQIALLSMEDPLIVESCAIDSVVVTYDSGQEYTWKNTNWMLHEDSEYYCPEATGLKTGATHNAGNCMIATFDTEETTLLIGVLGCWDLHQRFQDVLMLYEHYR